MVSVGETSLQNDFSLFGLWCSEAAPALPALGAKIAQEL
jgi:hypothetical protein